MTTASVFLVASVFLASVVEAVEALTIVLALGATRGWRAVLQGAGAGLIVLAAVIAVLGPTLTVLPVQALRLVVGGLLLVFGLQWLHKAILRAGGFKALHDEVSIYDRQLRAARNATSDRRGRLIGDGYGFALAFKTVLLEGLEVAVIVVTFGANQGSIGLATLGAVLAVVAVIATGIAVRAPLAKVPENTMKLAVGIMLTTFGTFWAAEGAGVHWPGDDAALLGVLVYVLLVALASIAVLRRLKRRSGTSPLAATAGESPRGN